MSVAISCFVSDKDAEKDDTNKKVGKFFITINESLKWKTYLGVRPKKLEKNVQVPGVEREDLVDEKNG